MIYRELNEIIIRAFERKDAVSLHQIVREKESVRFMRDWSENQTTSSTGGFDFAMPEFAHGFSAVFGALFRVPGTAYLY